MKFTGLPLYPEVRGLPVEEEPPAAHNPDCGLCSLHAGVRTVCMQADGEPGGLLVVGQAPGRQEDQAGRPSIGQAGVYLRGLLAKLWDGPVAYDNAVRCAPGARELTASTVGACRGYLAGTLAEARPTRILALGEWAAFALLGRQVAPMSVRRGYSYTAGSGVPVFMLINPAVGLRNRFVRQAFEEDLRWALKASPPRPPLGATANIVADAEAAEHAAVRLAGAEWFAFDCETAGHMFDADFRLLCVACCPAGSDLSYVWDAEALADPARAKFLAQLMSDPRAKKVGQNIKYDMLSIRLGLGTPVRGIHGDTRLIRKLLEVEVDGSLEVMAEMVGMGGHKEEAKAALDGVLKFFRSKKSAARKAQERGEPEPKTDDPVVDALVRLGADPMKYAYAYLPTPTLLRYNARDAVSTARLQGHLEERLSAEPELTRTWELLVRPAIHAVERVETWGVAVSAEAVGQFGAFMVARREEVRVRLAQYGDFNPDSPKSVGELLYGRLGLRTPHLTDDKGAPSTDKDALKILSSKHPVAADLLTWRHVNKLIGTYAEGLLPHIRQDGRIHSSFLLDGARSGRLSSHQPNLQNIVSAKTEDGKLIRDCFVAPAGKVLVQADFSQVELRIAAMLSGDELMIQIFRDGVDYHQRTAELISKLAWGIPPEQVTTEHRRLAKGVNFSVLYGQGDEALAAQLGCKKSEAATIKGALFGKFRGLARWVERCLDEARRTGHCWTWWDGQRARRRPLWAIGDQGSDGTRRSIAEHGSYNSVVQGTANEYCLASLVKCVEWIEQEGSSAKLVLPVHDSLMFECDEGEAEEVAWQAHRIMTGWPSGDVPLAVDVEWGRAWGSLESVPGSWLG